MPIHIIWGNDTNACDTEIKKIINKNVSKTWRDLNVSKLNGEDWNQVLQAFEEIQTSPLGDGSRVIVIRNNPLFNNKNDEVTYKFEQCLKNIPQSSYLIMQNTSKPDSRIKATKLLKELVNNKKASEISFNLPDLWDKGSQIAYIKNEANKLNIQLDEFASQELLETIGIESSRLVNELVKIKLYLLAKNENISDEKVLLKISDIKKLFNDHQTNLFKVIDCLIEQNILQAVEEINYLLIKGEPPLRLIAGLISQLRIHTIVLLLFNEKDNDKVCKLAGITNPKRIFYIKKKVKNSSPKFLINVMIGLLNIESLLKKGNNPINVFTENLITLNENLD